MTWTATISREVVAEYSDPIGVTIRSRNPYTPAILRTPEDIDILVSVLLRAQEEMIARRLGGEQRTGDAPV